MYPDKESVEAKLAELAEIGDPELVPELLRLYFETIEAKKNQMMIAQEVGEIDKLKFIAHSLKSTCGNLGSQSLFKKLVELEKNANTNQVQVMLKDVLTEIDQFSDFLAKKMN